MTDSAFSIPDTSAVDSTLMTKGQKHGLKQHTDSVHSIAIPAGTACFYPNSKREQRLHGTCDGRQWTAAQPHSTQEGPHLTAAARHDPAHACCYSAW